ncbi:hypothetical protein D3C73_1503260 [compost metagenome]
MVSSKDRMRFLVAINWSRTAAICAGSLSLTDQPLARKPAPSIQRSVASIVTLPLSASLGLSSSFQLCGAGVTLSER